MEINYLNTLKPIQVEYNSVIYKWSPDLINCKRGDQKKKYFVRTLKYIVFAETSFTNKPFCAKNNYHPYKRNHKN